MQDFEKLGAFYLGKLYDLENRTAKDELLLYDSKDLVTHAVVVGMTGSGKTGLCVGMIEEAAIDGVPSILIDPKGDLTNLLLAFPDLRPDDFQPWINLDDARQKGVTPEEFATQQAQLWASGLQKWGQDGERIRRFKNAAEFRIYTPASNAGIPVSILKSFAVPPVQIMEDSELLRERISTTVTSLLGLIGIDADPVQSREFILLANIIETTWRNGQDLDLAQLISQVQNPPVERIGVLDVESFYPGKERFGLVMALNNLLASPGFRYWLEGEPLDIGQMLYSPQGKPRVAIFSLAHLSDPERMFFVSLLLNQVLGWTRSQSGTTSLRAIVYMDEIFGYLPPSKNPPSKLPMLTMLKQARAFGVGMVLATQNPVDLDYKALSNAGTWFIGRLQTERDKMRVLEGLEGAATSAGDSFNRQEMDKLLSGLGNRVFLLNNIHEDAPVLMQTRWALSYLRGPLTREQIKDLMAPYKANSATAAPAQNGKTAAQPSAAPSFATASMPGEGGLMTTPPPMPHDVPVVYLPVRGRAPGGTELVYQPAVLGAARLTFSDSKLRLSEAQSKNLLASMLDGPVALDWEHCLEVDIPVGDMEEAAQGPATFQMPPAAVTSKHLASWKRDLTNWLYSNARIELLRSPSTGQVSQVGESDRDFRVRMLQIAREKRDAQVEALRKKYASKTTTLEERKRKAEQAVEREKDQARSAGFNTITSIGSTLLGAFTGRKVSGRAATALRQAGRTASQRGDIKRAEETVEAVDAQIQELEAQFQEEVARIDSALDPQSEVLETVSIRPKKTDINLQLVALAWAPYWQDSEGTLKPAWE